MKFSSLILCLFLLNSCESESLYQLSLRPSTAALMPEGAPFRYRNQDGDTLRLQVVFQESRFQEAVEDLPASGSLPEVDKIETEIRHLRLSAVNAPLEISYVLEVIRDPESRSGSRDQFELSMRDLGGGERLRLENKDSLRCLSSPCRFQESLKLLERNFQNVYFTPRDSVNIRMLYLNASNGLVGFRTINNDLYELLP